MAVKATGSKDTYRAAAVFLALVGLLHLADSWLHFSAHGLPWVMQKDTILIYAAVCFLWFKADKSVGIILSGVWIIQNISLVVSVLGQMSGFLLPVALLLTGIVLYGISSR